MNISLILDKYSEQISMIIYHFSTLCWCYRAYLFSVPWTKIYISILDYVIISVLTLIVSLPAGLSSIQAIIFFFLRNGWKSWLPWSLTTLYFDDPFVKYIIYRSVVLHFVFFFSLMLQIFFKFIENLHWWFRWCLAVNDSINVSWTFSICQTLSSYWVVKEIR